MFLTILISILLQIPQYEFESTSTYQPPTSHYSPSKPKKVSGWGYIDWLTWGAINGVPIDASNDDMYAYYRYINSGGSLSYNEWYSLQNASPIGSPILPLIIISILYLFATKMHRNFLIDKQTKKK